MRACPDGTSEETFQGVALGDLRREINWQEMLLPVSAFHQQLFASVIGDIA